MSKNVIIAALVCVCLIAPSSFILAGQDAETPQWKVRADFSYTNSSGNTDSETLALRVGIKKEETLNRYYLNGTVFRAESNKEETANKWLADGRYERVIQDRLYGLVEAYYSKDEFSGYDYRYGFGPGVGYDLIKMAAHSLKGSLSLLYSYDRYSKGAEKSDDYFAGKAGIKYEWRILKNLIFRENAYYHFSLDDADQYFLNSETALEVKINDRVSLGTSYIIAYQHEPPSPDIDDTDRIFMTSLIVDF